MALEKEVGGLGLHDPLLLSRVVVIKKVWRFWEAGSSICSQWLRDRYIKNQRLVDIKTKNRDSSMWLAILRAKDQIWELICCRSDCNLTMVIAGLKPKVKLLYKKLKGMTIPDP